ncbi:MAG TPA: caspase family protein, partial [Pyrinomonadaceae bacterium]|nr:caspase family protein [Pyrinomonadaceae bacterium]
MKRALLIAIRGYQAPFPKLEYPLNDVRRVEELLASPRYGFAGHIEKLTDDTEKKPTRENILAAMRRVLVDDAVAGDVVIIYYSGHGSSIKNTLNSENDLRDETIVPIDAARPSLPVDAFSKLKPEERPAFFAKNFHDIRDKELREMFHEAKKKGVMVTVILDSCHSGSATKGDEVSKEVDGVDVDLMLPPTVQQLAAKPEEDALVLAAAKDYQVATGGTHELRGEKALYSHFTAGLVEALYKTPADVVSADELFQEIVSGMQSQGRTMQTPVMIGAPPRTERTIFGTKPGGPAALVRSPGMSKDGSIFLTKAGITDGVAVGDEFKCVLPEKNGVAVRVKSVDISQSEVTTLPGTGDFATCNFFGQTRWSRGKLADLTVWMPPAMTAEQIKTAVASLKGMTLAAASEFPAPSIAFPEAAAGVVKWRKGATRAAAVATSGPLAKAGERVFADIPPSVELRNELIKEFATAGGYRVVATEDRSLAEYELIGTPDTSTGEVKYSWMLRAPVVENSALKATQKEPPLPPPTMPRMTHGIASSDPGAAADLANLARR